MMYCSLRVVDPPAREPVDLEVLRRHSRVDYEDDDDLLSMYLSSARMAAETYLGRVLLTQTLEYTFHLQPPNGSMPLLPLPLLIMPIILSAPQIMNRPFELPRSPVQRVIRVSHTNFEGETFVIDPDGYTADLTMDPARIKLHYLATPTRLQHVQTRFVAGFGDDPETVPLPIRHAIMLLTAHYFENRGDVGLELPRQFYDLLTPYRVMFFGG